MSKRFIDTELFDDPWFMDLSKDAKILWIYLITKCNHAGLIEINEKLCKFQTGLKSIQTVYKELGNRLVTVNEQLIFIPKFIEFQYPNFPQSAVRQQSSAIKLLLKYNLFNKENLTVNKGLLNSYEHEHENDTVNVNVNGNEHAKKTCLMENSDVKIEDIKEAFDKTKDLLDADPEYYYNVALDWSRSNNKMRIDWIATVRNFARSDLKDNKMKLLQKRDGAAEYKKELKLEIERKKNENREY